jgi:putative salt-induced outer membrane protein
MKSIKWLIILTLAGILFTGLAYAEEPADKKWKDEAEFLFVQTGGNTDVRTLAFKNMLEYKFSNPLIGVWNISLLDTETDGEQTAERYYTDLRMDYLFTEHWYAYVLGNWMKDEFAGFDQRYTIGPGAGYKILIGPKHFLLAEAGLAYASEDYVVEEDENFAEGRAFGKYEYAFTEKNRFSLASEYLHDFDDNSNYKSNSEAAVISALTDILSLKVSYEIRYQNRPKPSDLEKTDTVFGAAIVVTY